MGDVEGEMVAWCTKPGRGTRLIPKDSLQGVQFMKTPDYVQVVGFVDQSRINLDSSDFGGEMDPHGADLVRASLSPPLTSLTTFRLAGKPTRRYFLFECIWNGQEQLRAGY